MPVARNYSKTPSEVIDVAFDFRNTEALEDDPIASATVTESTGGVTIGTPTVDGTKVNCRISGGTDEAQYRLKVLATTTGGQIFQGDVLLDVDEPE